MEGCVIDESKVLVKEKLLAKFAITCLLDPATLVRQLNVPESDWQCTKSDCKDNSREQRYQVLLSWLQRNPGVSVKELRQLTDSGLNEVVKDFDLMIYDNYPQDFSGEDVLGLYFDECKRKVSEHCKKMEMEAKVELCELKLEFKKFRKEKEDELNRLTKEMEEKSAENKRLRKALNDKENSKLHNKIGPDQNRIDKYLVPLRSLNIC